MKNPEETTNTFNYYFLTVADNGIENIKKDNQPPRDNVTPSSYLINKYNNIFPRIRWNYATTYEIGMIIKFLD